MARGQIAKEAIKNKILKTFNDSFIYANGKEIRIPWEEEGKPVQIKISMTLAKEMVSPEGEVMKAAAVATEEDIINPISAQSTPVEPTLEEKQNVEDLLKSLGLQ